MKAQEARDLMETTSKNAVAALEEKYSDSLEEIYKGIKAAIIDRNDGVNIIREIDILGPYSDDEEVLQPLRGQARVLRSKGYKAHVVTREEKNYTGLRIAWVWQ
jgi:predicted RNA-binding protein associated with RNAse of E/G family